MAKTKEEDLTPKQQEVLAYLRKGDHPSQIAAALEITPNGVYQHMKRIREAGIDFPEVERRRGRPKGSGKKSAPAAATGERIGVVGGQESPTNPAIPDVSIEEALENEIEQVTERLSVIDTDLKKLAEEQDTLTARGEKLRKAQEALTV